MKLSVHKLSVALSAALVWMLLSTMVWAQNSDPDVDELIANQKKMAEQYKALNQMNPVSTDSSIDRFSQIDPNSVPENLRWVAKLLQDPRVSAFAKKFMLIVQNPEFLKNAVAISKNPNLKWYYGGLVLIFLIYAVLRRKVLSSTDRWFMRLILRFAMFIVFLTAQLLVAYAVMGQPLVNLVLIVERGLH